MQKNTSTQPRTKPVETLHKNTYFCHSPWQKCLLSKMKRLIFPSPIAMLFAVTQEMHAWAVERKEHCTRGGEGGEFVPSGHDALKCLNNFVRGCRWVKSNFWCSWHVVCPHCLASSLIFHHNLRLLTDYNTSWLTFWWYACYLISMIIVS